MDNPLTEMLFTNYEIASGRAALYELKLRLLADKIKELKNYFRTRKAIEK